MLILVASPTRKQRGFGHSLPDKLEMLFVVINAEIFDSSRGCRVVGRHLVDGVLGDMR